jgi:hypothetical protein
MKTFNSRLYFSTLSALSLVLGCQSSSPGEEWIDAAPEQAAFQIQVSGDTSAESLATDSDSIDVDMIDAGSAAADALDSMGGAPSDSVAPSFGQLREGVRALNSSLRAFLEPVVALLREEPSKTQGKLAVWGPVVRGATEYRVTIRRGGVHRFGWLLEARPADQDSDFVSVAAGRILVDRTPRRGTGVAGFDLTTLGGVDPTVVARGELLVGFAHGLIGSTLSYTVRDFTPNPSEHEPIDARVKGIHLERGLNVARLAYRGNIPETATDAEELVLARARHRLGQGGRVDSLVTGGDVKDGSMLVKSQCYDRGGVLGYSIVRECAEGELDAKHCTVLSKEGELKSCLPDFLEERLPPSDPSADEAEPDDPNDGVNPPESMPDGSAPTDI